MTRDFDLTIFLSFLLALSNSFELTEPPERSRTKLSFLYSFAIRVYPFFFMNFFITPDFIALSNPPCFFRAFSPMLSDEIYFNFNFLATILETVDLPMDRGPVIVILILSIIPL